MRISGEIASRAPLLVAKRPNIICEGALPFRAVFPTAGGGQNVKTGGLEKMGSRFESAKSLSSGLRRAERAEREV